MTCASYTSRRRPQALGDSIEICHQDDDACASVANHVLYGAGTLPQSILSCVLACVLDRTHRVRRRQYSDRRLVWATAQHNDFFGEDFVDDVYGNRWSTLRRMFRNETPKSRGVRIAPDLFRSFQRRRVRCKKVVVPVPTNWSSYHHAASSCFVSA